MNAVAYECEIAGLGSGPQVALAELVVREHGGGLGWTGWGRVRQADAGPAAALFGGAQAQGLDPGVPVVLTLAPAGEGPVRTWPSMLTGLEVRSGVGARLEVHVRFADPLTHLGTRPLYAAFAECTLGAILAGSLRRSLGVSIATDSHRIVHPSLPAVDIRESSQSKADRIEYSVAGGEPLLAFLRCVLDETGKRLSIRAVAPEEIRLDLVEGGSDPARTDDEPIRLAPSFETGTSAGTLSVRGLAADASGVPGASSRRPEKADGPGARRWVARAHAVSEEPELRAGGTVELTHGTLAGAGELQVVTVDHRLADRGYTNACHLVAVPDESPAGASGTPAGEALPPAANGTDGNAGPAPPRAWPRVLTGAVHEKGLPDGAAVPVDAGGRVPVQLACDPSAVVRLPFVVPAAGGVHGFAPACRAGDRVRVLVHGPLQAEVRGALFSDALAPDEESRGATHAIRVEAGLGAAFHPSERIGDLAP